MLENGCEAGCKVFSEGVTKHHPDCQHYYELNTIQVMKNLEGLKFRYGMYSYVEFVKRECVNGIEYVVLKDKSGNEKRVYSDLFEKYAQVLEEAPVEPSTKLDEPDKDLTEGERIHYESLKECCNKILDAVDAGKVPRRAIMGLRLLMNR